MKQYFKGYLILETNGGMRITKTVPARKTRSQNLVVEIDIEAVYPEPTIAKLSGKLEIPIGAIEDLVLTHTPAEPELEIPGH